MRRRFFNSGGAVEPPVETFSACEVTDDLVLSMDVDQTDFMNQAIGTVIMWDYEEKRFRAFIFDSFTLEASHMGHNGFKEYPKNQFLPFGILLYGRRQMQQIEHTNYGETYYPDNSITCVSLLTYNYVQGTMIPTVKEVATAWGEYYRVNKLNSFAAAISVKRDTSSLIGDTKTLPQSMYSNDPLLQASTQNANRGYNTFLTTDAYYVLSGGLIQGVNIGGTEDDVVYDVNDMVEESFVMAYNGYTGAMGASSAMYSPFVDRGIGEILNNWCCPDLNQDTYMYRIANNNTTKATLEDVMFEPRLGQQNNTFLKDMANNFITQFEHKVDGWTLRIPTIYELRMMFARLGRISEVESELQKQGLITTPIATLFADGPDGLGGVVLSANIVNLSINHYGIQGVTARLVSVSPIQTAKSSEYASICIPFFRLTSDMFV